MNMRNEIFIAAPAQRIYAIASATERWPDVLPHYRFVDIVWSSGTHRNVRMGARRGIIPVSWRAEQINDPDRPGIYFRHTGGWTSGMEVHWRFEPEGGGTRVSIDHELRSPLAAFIGTYFVDPIATRTLARVKQLAEGA